MKSMYEVESIVGKRKNPKNGRIQYRVKWVGYSENQNTWQPLQNLKYVQDLVQQYDNANKSIADPNFFDQSMSSVLKIGQSDQHINKIQRKKKKSKLNEPQMAVKKVKDVICQNTAATRKDIQNIRTLPFSGGEQKTQAITTYKSTFTDSLVSGISNMYSGSSMCQENKQLQKTNQLTKNFQIIGMKNEPKTGFWYFVVCQNGNERWIGRDFMIQNWPARLCQFYEQRLVFTSKINQAASRQ